MSDTPPPPDPTPHGATDAESAPVPGQGPGHGPEPVPDGEAPAFHSAAPDTHAQLHDTEATRTYPCDACGGELHFDIDSQKLKCAHCGNVHELVDAGGTVHERDLREAIALVRAGVVERSAQFLHDEREIVCQNCGGHTTFTGSWTAQNCPYCATPIQRDDVHDAPQRLPVDGVLPFTVGEAQAKELIEEWINGRWFAPNEFKTYNRTGSFSSVYTAYFTYDADTFTLYTGRRGDHYTVTVGSGDDQRTETRTRWTPARGSVRNSFDDIAVFANDGFERKRIEKLEPWPTEDSKSYSAEYVAGHLCRTYDRDVEQCMSEATTQMERTIRSTVERDIGGDEQVVSSMDINWQRMTYKHLLLPIWLLTVIYADRPFQVYINGVTGEVHGARPYSKIKIAVTVTVAVLLVILILIALSASRSGAG